jgi:hypothetical protein
MKNKIKISFLMYVLFTLNSFGKVDFNFCVEAGTFYGSQKTIVTVIPDVCKKLIEESHIKDVSNNNNIKVFARKNLVYIQFFSLNENKERVLIQDHFISGENSKLTDVRIIRISELDKKIYVLNSDRNELSLLSYFYEVGGNISPARKLITSDLAGADDFILDSNLKEIYVISNKGNWLKVFHQDADPDGKRENNSVAVKRSMIGNENGFEGPLEIIVDDSNLFLLDNYSLKKFPKIFVDTTKAISTIEVSSSKLNTSFVMKLNQKFEIDLYLDNQIKKTFSVK